MSKIVLQYKVFFITILMAIGFSFYIESAEAANLKGFERQVQNWAEECRNDVIKEFQKLLASGTLTLEQLFDTFYIPIPNTNPQKYQTQYDKFIDAALQKIFDEYLLKSKRVVYTTIVDRNGYLPTHNTIFSQPLTGDVSVDIKQNRTKRIFNDKTGFAAARNREPYLIQEYRRDTGEVLMDFSMPIEIEGLHWGAVRIGYKK